MLYFLTTNENKFLEVKAILAPLEIEQLNIDLPEIQDLDAFKIMQAKLQEALKHHPGELIVEDTSLYLDALNGLPGPLIKWFLPTLGLDGLANLASKLNNTKATAKTIIGYAQDAEHIHFFEGELNGNIVPPRGQINFGWNAIFQPNGSEMTFAEMPVEQKNQLSMRKLAVEKFKEFKQS